MNKDLEIEYQNMIRAEVPDIWDKIEAKIDAQEAQKKVVPFKKKTSRWKYYVLPVAAALLCVAVAIPVMTNSRKAKSGRANYAAPASTQSCDTGSAASVIVTEQAEYAASTDAEAPYEEMNEAAASNESRGQASAGQHQNAMSFLSGDRGTSSGTQAAADNSEKTADESGAVCEAQSSGGNIVVFTIKVPVSVPGSVIEKIAEDLDLQIEDCNAGEGIFVLVSGYELSNDDMEYICGVLGENEHIAEVSVTIR